MIVRILVTSMAMLLAFPFASASAAPEPEPRQVAQPSFAWTTGTVEETASTITTLGIHPAVLSTYAPFSEPFPQRWAQEAKQRSRPLVISWEPWNWNLPPQTDQPKYSLASIAAGTHDRYIRTWARAAKNSGTTILIRFAPEMNGDWNPWSLNETPQAFKQAWKHLHTIFAQEKATNVRWVFNPSVTYDGATPISLYWPGKQYVDWIAVDGYNWQGVLPARNSTTVQETFGETIRQLTTLAPHLPLMIAECGAGPETKEAWLLDLIRTAPQLDVDLVIWFEHDKETDWRLASAQLPAPLPVLLSTHNWRLLPA